jgi:HTH-type transcriptional regulator/antitoxin MqsA
MVCGACGADHLIHDTRDFSFSYKGKRLRIPSLEADYCAACGEVILDAKGGARMNASMCALDKELDSAIKKNPGINRGF